MMEQETFNRINNTFAEHADIIQYMRQSQDHFLAVVDQLQD